MPHKADPTVICQCGAIISKYYMPKHIQTAKHTRDMVVIFEKIKKFFKYTYVFVCLCVCVFVCLCVCVCVCVCVCRTPTRYHSTW
jgi:hypothetical protein